jgi:hypothetical protein
MRAGAERVQHLPLTHEHRRLALLHDDLRAKAKVTRPALRLAVDQLVIHHVDMINDVNNPWHVIYLL